MSLHQITKRYAAGISNDRLKAQQHTDINTYYWLMTAFIFHLHWRHLRERDWFWVSKLQPLPRMNFRQLLKSLFSQYKLRRVSSSHTVLQYSDQHIFIKKTIN